MELQISRRIIKRALRVLGSLSLLLAITLGLYGVGLDMSPRTEQGRPVLYSPAVRAAVTYQRRVARWLMELDQVGDTLSGLLADTGADLYSQNTQAEAALGQTLQIAQAVAVQTAPTALATVARQMTDVSLVYYQAAQLVAAFVAAPSGSQLTFAVNAVEQARSRAQALADNRWVRGNAWQP